MANQEQLQRLQQAVMQTWNRWRSDYPDLLLDLDNADVSETHLGSFNLSYAHLCGANLTNTDGNNADFSHAILVGTNLRGANLANADLRFADFSGANLSDTYLRGADLSEAIITSAQREQARSTKEKL